MTDTRTMSELLQAPTEGYGDAIIIPAILAEKFKLKVRYDGRSAYYGLIAPSTHRGNKQFFGHDKEDPHAHVRYFNKITSTLKFPNVPNTSIMLMLFPFSLEGYASSKQDPSIASVKVMEEICVTFRGLHPYYEWLAIDINTFNTSAATGTYNQGGQGYRPQGEANYRASNQMRPPGFPQPNVQNNQNR
nr:reverse transcriptase domain-containing protein [Tanacetum cinerariifolium]